MAWCAEHSQCISRGGPGILRVLGPARAATALLLHGSVWPGDGVGIVGECPESGIHIARALYRGVRACSAAFMAKRLCTGCLGVLRMVLSMSIGCVEGEWGRLCLFAVCAKCRCLICRADCEALHTLHACQAVGVACVGMRRALALLHSAQLLHNLHCTSSKQASAGVAACLVPGAFMGQGLQPSYPAVSACVW
jgi:hypothetical protein